jgi:CHAT domain-containing protein/tetratricopeptide (TPR) repeat protein
MYLLSIQDGKSLTAGDEYDWHVTCLSNATRYTSVTRRFRFRQSAATGSYLRLSEEQRTAYFGRVHDSPDSMLPKVLKDIDTQLTTVGCDPSPDRAWLLQTRADLLNRLERYGESLTSYKESLDLWRQLGMPDELSFIRALVNEGLASEEVGSLNSAFNNYAEALTLMGGQRQYFPTMATCFLNLGRLYRQWGQMDKARQAYDNALSIDRTLGDPGPLAEDLTNYANIIVDEMNDANQGVQLLSEALDFHRQWAQRHGSLRDSFSSALDSAAHAERIRGNFPLARRYYLQAIQFDDKRHSLLDVMLSLNNLADLEAEDLKAPKNAITVYQRAIRTGERFYSTNPDLVWQSYDGLGHVYLKLGMYPEAEGEFRKAERIVGSIEAPVAIRSFKSEHSALSYDMAWLKYRQADLYGMFSAMESVRRTSLLKPGLSPLALSGLERNLKDGELFLMYREGIGRDPVLLLAASMHGSVGFELASTVDIERTGDRVRDALRSGRDVPGAHAALRELAADLLPSDVTREIVTGRVRRLVVSVDGGLSSLPFEALVVGPSDAENYLLRWVPVSFVPSATWWYGVRKSGDPAFPVVGDALVVADPVMGVSKELANPSGQSLGGLTFSALPASRREASSVMKWAHRGSLTLLGSQCSSHSFGGARPYAFKIVHFATHAVSGDSVDSSFLVFGQSGSLDVLSGSAILTLPLRNQLVVLSGCETAAGHPLAGQERDSLAYAFLAAGAAEVVATRWQVADRYPPRLMEFFYESLAGGASVNEALRAAQLKMASESAGQIGQWAAFESIGYGDLHVSVTPIWWISVWRAFSGSRGMLLVAAAVCAAALIIAARLWARRTPEAKAASG